MQQDLIKKEELINLSEAARRYGRGPRLLRDLIEQGILYEYDDGSRQRYLSVIELDEYFKHEKEIIKRPVLSFETAVAKLSPRQREAAEFVASCGLGDTVAYILGGSPSKRENETVEHLAQCIPAIPDSEKERFIRLYRSLPEDIYASTHRNVAFHMYRILKEKPEAFSQYLDSIEKSSRRDRRDFTEHLHEEFIQLMGLRDDYFPSPIP